MVIKKRKIQQGLTEVSFGPEYNDFKILNSKQLKEFEKNPKKYVKLWKR